MESKLERREKTGGGCVGTQLRDGGGLYNRVAEGMKGWILNVQEVIWPGPSDWPDMSESCIQSFSW